MLKLDTTNLSPRVHQHGVLHGGLDKNCRTNNYPGIYTRLDEKEVWSFINRQVFEGK